jgi:hypothetical protein
MGGIAAPSFGNLLQIAIVLKARHCAMRLGVDQCAEVTRRTYRYWRVSIFAKLIKVYVDKLHQNKRVVKFANGRFAGAREGDNLVYRSASARTGPRPLLSNVRFLRLLILQHLRHSSPKLH